MIRVILSAIICLYLSVSGFSQSIPADSKRAVIGQRLGLSDVTITYYRPNVNGRKIFGELVPYGEVWRTGADYPTFIRLTDTTYVGNKSNRLLPGKYALYTIPDEDKWTIIFSRDTALWGSYGYKQENDALRYDVKAESPAIMTQTFTISFDDVQDEMVSVSLCWENAKASFPLMVDVKDRVITYVQKTAAGKDNKDWGVYWKGAKYLLRNKLDINLAEEWINRSISMNEGWVNSWIKAQILAEQGKYKDAITTGKKAIEIGNTKENKPYFPYESTYAKKITEWEALLNGR